MRSLLRMLQGIDAALDRSLADPTIRAIAIDGAGDRGLCAGGDVKLLAANTAADAERFWRIEYRVNARIAEHPLPYVALMDGIVMGGGIGVSGHGSVRVVTERSRLAMPEVRIGLAPDVGGAHLLARAPGELGTHLALTAASFDGADAIALGVADLFVPSERLPGLLRGTRDGDGTRPRSHGTVLRSARHVVTARAALLDRRVLRGGRRGHDPPPAREPRGPEGGSRGGGDPRGLADQRRRVAGGAPPGPGMERPPS